MQLKGPGLRIGSSDGQFEDLVIPTRGRFSDVTGFGHASIPISDSDEPRISMFIPIIKQDVVESETVSPESAGEKKESGDSDSTSDSGYSDSIVDTAYTELDKIKGFGILFVLKCSVHRDSLRGGLPCSRHVTGFSRPLPSRLCSLRLTLPQVPSSRDDTAFLA
jgi:hypothetical protein